VLRRDAEHDSEAFDMIATKYRAVLEYLP